MKIKIIIQIIVQTVFLSAISAQITRKEADSIVIERMSREKPPYWISKSYSPLPVPAGEAITSNTGEVIELDYSCWIYYVNYSDWVDYWVKRDWLDFGRGCAPPEHYLIVNENNGNLLEIKSIDKFRISNDSTFVWRGARVGCDCRDELFYNDDLNKSGSKIFFDYSFMNDCLLVGLEPQVQLEEMHDYLMSTGLFKAVSGLPTLQAYDKNSIMYAYTKEKYTCSQLKEIISILEQSSLVAYANLTFRYYAMPGEFIVELKKGTDFSDIETLMQETNTKMIRKAGAWYYLSADKNSKGNSLQMAQYFYETGKFSATWPCFIKLSFSSLTY